MNGKSSICLEYVKIKAQLEIAIEALEVYKREADVNDGIAIYALDKIKELEK